MARRNFWQGLKKSALKIQSLLKVLKYIFVKVGIRKWSLFFLNGIWLNRGAEHLPVYNFVGYPPVGCLNHRADIMWIIISLGVSELSVK